MLTMQTYEELRIDMVHSPPQRLGIMEDVFKIFRKL